MIIDHIAIVVKDLNIGIMHWRDVFGYEQMTNIVVNKKQKVRVVFLQKEDSIDIKLIEPVGETSPIYKFSKKGGGLHHLCFKCNDVDETIEFMRNNGLRILSDPQPGEAFDNERIAFVYAKHGMNIELIETEKRAEMILDRTER